MDELRDWFTTIGMIIVKPSPQTLILESQKAKGKLAGAIIWLVLATIGMNLHVFFVRGDFWFPLLLFTAVLLPIDFLFFVFCVHLLYKKMFNRKRECYNELLYLIVSIFIPFITILLFTNQIPVIGEILSWTGLIYSLFLVVVAVTTITKLEFGQSVTIVFLGLVMSIAGFFCFPAFFASIMRAVPGVLQ